MDTPETMALALIQSAGQAIVETRAIVQKGALNIKTQAKVNVLASAPTHNAYAHNAITYDTDIKATTVVAEIGFDKDKNGGALGNILEYGTRKNPGQRNLGRAADIEEPRFEDAIGLMATRLLN